MLSSILLADVLLKLMSSRGFSYEAYPLRQSQSSSNLYSPNAALSAPLRAPRTNNTTITLRHCPTAVDGSYDKELHRSIVRLLTDNGNAECHKAKELGEDLNHL